jgi:quercetin dioxygenase-like cupin family protein
VVAALPSGTLYITVSDLVEPASASTKAPSVAGVLFVLQGTAHLSAGSQQDLPAGEGAFIKPQSGLTISNPGTASAEWYFISAQLASGRNGPPPLAGAKILFATDNLPSLPLVNQAEVLTKVSVPPGGQTAQYRPNGVEAFIGLDGSVEIKGNETTTLATGRVLFYLEGSPLQALNTGSSPATYISFFLQPDGTALTRPDRQ